MTGRPAGAASSMIAHARSTLHQLQWIFAVMLLACSDAERP